MADYTVLNSKDHTVITHFFSNADWREIVKLRHYWPRGFQRLWYREYIRKSLKPHFCDVWWRECMVRVQLGLNIPVRPNKDWPLPRYVLLDCLFVCRGAQVIISGLIGESICYNLHIPKELCTVIREFVGDLPSLVCEDDMRGMTKLHEGWCCGKRCQESYAVPFGNSWQSPEYCLRR